MDPDVVGVFTSWKKRKRTEKRKKKQSTENQINAKYHNVSWGDPTFTFMTCQGGAFPRQLRYWE